ncbi:hypothetical protein BC829DRAFT_72486 [Chytridium lagenaria]|nr:hypothetical protein BC829DRAFT_72486 [Chytridium lagenaria]
MVALPSFCVPPDSHPRSGYLRNVSKKVNDHCIERFDLPAKYLIRNHDLIKNIVSGLMIMKEPPFSDTVENFNYWVERTSRQMAIPLSRITVKGTEFIIKNAAAFCLNWFRLQSKSCCCVIRVGVFTLSTNPLLRWRPSPQHPLNPLSRPSCLHAMVFPALANLQIG